MTDLGLPSGATPYSFQEKIRHWGSLRASSASSVSASLFPFIALITLFYSSFNSKHLMNFLLKKNQVLKPFQNLVSDSNDKKVLSNPIVLFFGVLWALVILGDIFFKYSGYQTVRFPLFWLLETFIYIAAGTRVLAAFLFVSPISIWGDMHPKREKIEEKWQKFFEVIR